MRIKSTIMITRHENLGKYNDAGKVAKRVHRGRHTKQKRKERVTMDSGKSRQRFVFVASEVRSIPFHDGTT